MTDEKQSGIAIIAGSIGGILAMAIHPVASASLTAEQATRLAVISAVAHSIAIVCIVLLFLGACGLTRAIGAQDHIAFAGIVTYGFACVAVFIAAAVSGFIIPGILKHMVRDVPAAVHQWQVVIDGIFQINQAFGRIYSVGASVAIILWSWSALRNGGIGRGVVVYGCMVSALIILGIGSGHVRLNVHGMAAIWFAQAIWFVLVGSTLCSRAASRTRAV
jgi:hypothetical protein